jgi:hypothetical protein
VLAIVATVILTRFMWVFPTTYRARAATRFSEAEGQLIARKQEHFTVVLAAVAAGRAELLHLHRAADIHDMVLHALERELDLEEMTARRHLEEPTAEGS